MINLLFGSEICSRLLAPATFPTSSASCHSVSSAEAPGSQWRADSVSGVSMGWILDNVCGLPGTSCTLIHGTSGSAHLMLARETLTSLAHCFTLSLLTPDEGQQWRPHSEIHPPLQCWDKPLQNKTRPAKLQVQFLLEATG